MLAAFRDGKLRTLIATDIAARGIDVDGVSHVFNYDLPNIPESYVHRIGRTARAGAEGIAISFCDHEERAFLRDIERLIRMAIPATDRRTGGRPLRPRTRRKPAKAPLAAGRIAAAISSAAMAAAIAAVMAVPAITANAPIMPAMAANGHQGRPQHARHAAPHQEATAGEPSDIGNVTFMQRSGAPRSNAQR